jgi:hypothetical protein
MNSSINENFVMQPSIIKSSDESTKNSTDVVMHDEQFKEAQ